MYRVCKSYADQSLCISELADACLALKEKIGCSAPDARTVALDNIIGIARSSQMMLNFFDSWTKGDEMIRQIIPQLIGLTTVTPDAVRTAGDMLNKSAKLSLAVLAQFQIENVLRNLARELGLPEAGTGFYRTAYGVLTALSLPQDRMDVLNTPARIRNSLHSNGIHHRQHPTEAPRVTIRGVTYEFEDGKPVSCASWEHIAHALEASVGVLDEVLSSQQVRAIPDPMMDQYAWEQATKPGGAV